MMKSLFLSMVKTLFPDQVNHQKMSTRFLSKRRKIKTEAYFIIARWTIVATLFIFVLSSTLHCALAFSKDNHLHNSRTEWISRSINYYSGVMKKPSNQKDSFVVDATPVDSFVKLAMKHYQARLLVKQGKLETAERLYRRIIDELRSDEEEDCDHAALAVSTLLLALHTQRTSNVKADTRRVFNDFFRVVDLDNNSSCACSARVLQAYALFEMKNGNQVFSLMLMKRAVDMDERLKPVLEWWQFREARSKSASYSLRFQPRPYRQSHLNSNT
mmetsp:Transcript_13728/g.28988  ORF Transcript_13728/g.28988 Transcript_13728/m.28988 type:complete len:272 (+) Transcript_13728:307-1122(+)